MASASFPFGDCRVCRSKATGIHYGVATCEGCKAFFKRSITKHVSYRCYFGANCLIIPDSRNRCKFCRFKRCLDLGMSMEAVKMGRIPKAEKVQALLEQGQVDSATAAVHDDSNMSAPMIMRDIRGANSNCPTSMDGDVRVSSEKMDVVGVGLATDVGTLSESDINMAESYTTSSSSLAPHSPTNLPKMSVSFSLDEAVNYSTCGAAENEEAAASISALAGANNDSGSSSGGLSDGDTASGCPVTEHILRTVSRLRNEPIMFFYTEDLLQQLEGIPDAAAKEAALARARERQRQVFRVSSSENLSLLDIGADVPEVFRNIVLSEDLNLLGNSITSIVKAATQAHLQSEKIVDYQIEYFYDEMRNPQKYIDLMKDMTVDDAFRKSCEKAVIVMQVIAAYCKSLPGYNQLHADDQKQAIVDSHFDVWLVNNSGFLINGQSYLRYPDGTKYTRHLMNGLIGEEMVETLFQFANHFNALCLNASEISVIKAILLTRPRLNSKTNSKSLLPIMHKSWNIALRYCLLHKVNNDMERMSELIAALNNCMWIMAVACDFNTKKVLPLLLKRKS